MAENWKPYPRDPMYDVSTAGNVRSWVKPGPGGYRLDQPVLRVPCLTGPPKKQYYGLTLRGGVPAKIHLMVLETFRGERPKGMEGCHENGDKFDNRLSNLRWDTPGANARDKRSHGTDHQVKKTHCPRGHEYTEDNVYGGLGNPSRRCKSCARDRALKQYRSGYVSPSKRTGSAS